MIYTCQRWWMFQSQLPSSCTELKGHSPSSSAAYPTVTWEIPMHQCLTTLRSLAAQKSGRKKSKWGNPWSMIYRVNITSMSVYRRVTFDGVFFCLLLTPNCFLLFFVIPKHVWWVTRDWDAGPRSSTSKKLSRTAGQISHTIWAVHPWWQCPRGVLHWIV